MRKVNSKRALAAASALSLVVGAGGAIAASKGSAASGDGFLARVAGHLGISTEKLEDATKAAAIDQVDADLKAGRITKGQAEELKARIREGGAPFLFRGPHRFGDFGHHGPFGGHLSAAGDYLGLSVPELLEKLSPETSLADVAKELDKSVDGLKKAMLAEAKERLDKAVEDGMLAEARAREIVSRLESKIDAIVDGTFRGPFRHEEFRFRGGSSEKGPWGPLPPAA
jgi:hypothetical protein